MCDQLAVRICAVLILFPIRWIITDFSLIYSYVVKSMLCCEIQLPCCKFTECRECCCHELTGVQLNLAFPLLFCYESALLAVFYFFVTVVCSRLYLTVASIFLECSMF